MSVHTTPDSYTKLLIHSNTSDESTTFVDSSATAHTVTPTATAQHDTAQVKFGATSMLFDGNSDYLTIADNSEFDFGTGDFTIDFWLRLNSAAGNKNYIARRGDGFNDSLWFFRTENGPEYQFYWNDNSNNYNMLGGVPETNVWHHLAIVRSGREVKMYEDGIVIDTHTESTARSFDAGLEVLVGARYGSGTAIQFLDGWLDEVRISKGIARWSDTFVPPNKPYSVMSDDFVTDVAGIEDDGAGNTTFGRDIVVKSNPDEASTDSVFSVNKKDGTVLLDVLANGRGLSQFTAKAWVNFNGTGTPSVNDSHNVSSISDMATGNYRVNFTNAMDNADYSWTGAVGDWDVVVTGATPNAAYAPVQVLNVGSHAQQDKNYVMAIVFGD